MVEGYPAALALRRVAARERGHDADLRKESTACSYEQLPAEQVVRGLMLRPIKPEFD